MKMTEPIQGLVRAALSPLAREVRSSIDFFERQHEHHVVAAFACGGTATSPHILKFLGADVGLHIECWNPLATYDASHLNGDGTQLMTLAPNLAAVIGVAVARL